MRTTTLFFLLAALPACGDDAQASPRDLIDRAVGQVAEQAKGLQTTVSGLATTLAGITDGPSARQAEAKLRQLVTQLEARAQGGLAAVAKEVPGLQQALAGTLRRVAGLIEQADVRAAIGPLLERAQRALGG